MNTLALAYIQWHNCFLTAVALSKQYSAATHVALSIKVFTATPALFIIEPLMLFLKDGSGFVGCAHCTSIVREDTRTSLICTHIHKHTNCMSLFGGSFSPIVDSAKSGSFNRCWDIVTLL